MTESPFVSRIHVEPAECRRDIEDAGWDIVAGLLQTLGVGPERRLDLYGHDSLTVMSIGADGDAFHVSVQVGELRYFCLRGTAGASSEFVEVGPFAYNAAEVCHSRGAVADVVHAFWSRGEYGGVGWSVYEAGDALSPLNDTMAKAAAEIGAMVQALEAGNKGGDATLRVQGAWNASPATRADMKMLARRLELSKLTVIDADGTARSFEGDELLPTAAGGKRWET